MKKFLRKDGFTIIEVVLVLAIAGLIFLMMFVALPTLQRNSRDAQRREDMLTFQDEIKKYQTNNRGALPVLDGNREDVDGDTVATDSRVRANSWSGFYRDYLLKTSNSFKDPSGDTYDLQVVNCNASSPTSPCTGIPNPSMESNKNLHTIRVVLQANCNSESAVGNNNPRKAAILYKLEGGGTYCGEI